MKRIAISLLIILCSLCHSASAQTLSLDSCIDMALRANRQVEKARLQTRQRESTVSAMKANFLPNFKASARDLYTTTDGSFSIAGGYLPTFIPGADGTLQPNVRLNPATGQPMMSADGTTPVFQQYAYFPTQDVKYKLGNIIQASISVEQPIYMGGKISAGYAMSKLAHEMALQNERLTDAQVIVSTEEAYALLVRATELRAVAQQYDSLLLRLQRDVQSARSHGMASHNDVLKVGVKKNEAELQLRQAENGRRLAQMNLCQLIGLPLDSSIVPEIHGVEDSHQALPPPSLKGGSNYQTREGVSSSVFKSNRSLPLGRAGGESGRVGSPSPSPFIASRPEATLLSLKSQLAEQKVKLERSEFLPQIGIAAGYSYLYGVKVNDRRLFDSGSFAAMLNISIPLFHFGEGRYKVRAARFEAQQARIEEQELMEKMQLEATREANNLDEAGLELDITARNVSQAAENLRIARRSYDLGMESLSDLLEAQTLYQQACAKLVEARCQLSLATARYRKATGQELR